MGVVLVINKATYSTTVFVTPFDFVLDKKIIVPASCSNHPMWYYGPDGIIVPDGYTVDKIAEDGVVALDWEEYMSIPNFIKSFPKPKEE